MLTMPWQLSEEAGPPPRANSIELPPQPLQAARLPPENGTLAFDFLALMFQSNGYRSLQTGMANDIPELRI